MPSNVDLSGLTNPRRVIAGREAQAMGTPQAPAQGPMPGQGAMPMGPQMGSPNPQNPQLDPAVMQKLAQILMSRQQPPAQPQMPPQGPPQLPPNMQGVQ